MVYYIEPLAIAANITQAPSCELGQVLLLLANLWFL